MLSSSPLPRSSTSAAESRSLQADASANSIRSGQLRSVCKLRHIPKKERHVLGTWALGCYCSAGDTLRWIERERESEVKVRAACGAMALPLPLPRPPLQMSVALSSAAGR